MGKYEIGQPFPDSRCLTIDGMAIRFSETSFDILLVMDKSRVEELFSLSNRTFTYGLFVENHIPFIVFDFDNKIKMNCVFNLLSLPPARAINWLVHNTVAFLNIYFIDKEFGLLQDTRSFYLNNEFTKQLKSELEQLWRTYKSKDQIDAEIARIISEYDLAAMNTLCTTRFTVIQTKTTK